MVSGQEHRPIVHGDASPRRRFDQPLHGVPQGFSPQNFHEPGHGNTPIVVSPGSSPHPPSGVASRSGYRLLARVAPRQEKRKLLRRTNPAKLTNPVVGIEFFGRLQPPFPLAADATVWSDRNSKVLLSFPVVWSESGQIISSLGHANTHSESKGPDWSYNMMNFATSIYPLPTPPDGTEDGTTSGRIDFVPSRSVALASKSLDRYFWREGFDSHSVFGTPDRPWGMDSEGEMPLVFVRRGRGGPTHFTNLQAECLVAGARRVPEHEHDFRIRFFASFKVASSFC